MSDQIIFNSEEEIIAAIEEAQAAGQKLLELSVTIEAEGRELIRSSVLENIERGQAMLKEAGMKDRKAQRVSGDLQKLKNALAAFRTEVMPSVIPQGDGQKRVVV